jgi:hypothetical protein
MIRFAAVLTCAILLTAGPLSAQTFGDWVVSRSSDSMTDQVTVFAVTRDARANGGFAVTCVAGAPAIMVYHRFVGGAKKQFVTRPQPGTHFEYSSE